MAPDEPGWYRDPHRPGMRRYWDGHAWVDVDQVVDGHPDPPATPRASGPRIVSQRRPGAGAGNGPAGASPEDESEPLAD